MANESTSRECPNCGAPASRLSARFCEYCGTELPRPVPAPQPAPASPVGDVAARFTALEHAPELEELLKREPATGAIALQQGLGIGGIVVFVLIGLLATGVFFLICPPLGLVPLVIVVVGALAFSGQLSRRNRFAKSSLQRVPALVVDERTKISGGGGSFSASTSYLATLEFPDGSRREYPVDDTTAGKLTQGDMGIAYLRADHLLDFGRVRV